MSFALRRDVILARKNYPAHFMEGSVVNVFLPDSSALYLVESRPQQVRGSCTILAWES